MLKKNFRGKGIAKSLRKAVFALIKEKGYKAILRSACTDRPHMIELLRSECSPAGSLTFLNGTIEYFFWHKLE